MDAAAVKAAATKVMAGSARLSGELGPWGDFDLRIVFTRCMPEASGMQGLLHRLEEPAKGLDGNKRITLV